MSYTSFGEFMRVLRVKNHEVMGDVAKTLEPRVIAQCSPNETGGFTVRICKQN